MAGSETLIEKLTRIADATRQKSGIDTKLTLDEIRNNIEDIDAEEHEAYNGPEKVKPGFEPQTLPTRGRSMDEDIVITPIEVIEVSNMSDGHPLII